MNFLLFHTEPIKVEKLPPFHFGSVFADVELQRKRDGEKLLTMVHANNMGQWNAIFRTYPIEEKSYRIQNNSWKYYDIITSIN